MDLVIGAVLVHGAKAPHVVTRAQLGMMKKNAVLVDVARDQGLEHTTPQEALALVSAQRSDC